MSQRLNSIDSKISYIMLRNGQGMKTVFSIPSSKLEMCLNY